MHLVSFVRIKCHRFWNLFILSSGRYKLFNLLKIINLVSIQ